jgi:hypothetical protein
MVGIFFKKKKQLKNKNYALKHKPLLWQTIIKY